MQQIFAHRGASGHAPENTLLAFDLAADMKADGVELDVQFTRDGQLAVFHDETLRRVTGQPGRVCDYTMDELRNFPVISWKEQGMVDGIPTLQEVLSLLHRRGLKVNIELKNSILPFPGLEEAVLAAVKQQQMEDATIYSSFNHYSMVKMKSLSDHAVCGLLYDSMLVKPWDYAHTLGVDALHPYLSELTVKEEVPSAHALGLMVNPWTVNTEQDLRFVFGAGADVVISNYPDRAREILNAMG